MRVPYLEEQRGGPQSHPICSADLEWFGGSGLVLEVLGFAQSLNGPEMPWSGWFWAGMGWFSGGSWWFFLVRF